ncbi:hypothetical protein [Mycolicibacterium confluentis]|uniref:Uncharacterized protein n=1 Tax=Mycolicibacterium confluentis TaxID=28047 RepID=A0A7I7XUL9_9MYCO|nr:hypothetical protein [Mycolicibacterium confluentis]MCV7322332.1 hypothetical protein [Mycolicibacterium confluentis]ORV28350.1 hypothetical protein AWB99_17575 [Mycolicibacterium confluentis]BBZ32980.1 hypothetical protein MCNF_15850 [Mycolicibacterium confluentis]
MSPSTEPTQAERKLAADVLQKLLRHIAIENVKNAESRRPGHYVFEVSHAWTEGATMYLLYTTPPSDITWGLVRDTRRSLIDPGPWNDTDDPALYYYLLDLEEEWPGHIALQKGDDPDTIRWSGYPLEGLPERVSDIAERYRYTPPATAETDTRRTAPPVIEPRRYAD